MGIGWADQRKARGRVREPFSTSPEFRRLLRGVEDVDLARINLEIARDADPEVDVDATLAAIDALAARVRAEGAAAADLIGAINRVLFEEDEFRGNAEDYFDPRNSYLHEVMDRRLGIPISLAILYAAVAGRLGLRLDGVNTPLHFLLRVTEAEPALFVDPYHGGATLDRPACERLISELSGQEVRLSFEHFTPCNPSTVVARMLRNLKRAYLDRREFAEALPVVRRLAALNRHDLPEQRDWGLTAVRAGRPGEAIDPLARYVAEAKPTPEVERVAEFLRAAREEVATWN